MPFYRFLREMARANAPQIVYLCGSPAFCRADYFIFVLLMVLALVTYVPMTGMLLVDYFYR